MRTSKILFPAGILQVRPLAELTISYLESLSTGELIELAAKHGLDIPPGLERGFIIEELLYLDYDAEDTDHYKLYHNEFNEIAILPKRYHISYIDVLIRDPLWVFAFWEIKAHDRDMYENTANFEGYCLRVIPLREGTLKEVSLREGSPQPDQAASFIVAIDADDCARYLGFPPEDGRFFKVELCVQMGEDITALAESRPFVLPFLIGSKVSNELTQAVYRNPLAEFSGAGRFSLIHSEDRQPRPRDTKG